MWVPVLQYIHYFINIQLNTLIFFATQMILGTNHGNDF